MSFKRLKSGLLVPEFNIQPFGVNLRRAVDAASMGTLVGAKPPSGATLLFGPADFEEADLTDWSSTSTLNGGTISATGASARSGSYGCDCTIPTPGSTDRRATGNASLSSVTEYFSDAYFNINNVTMADGDEWLMTRPNNNTQDGAAWIRRSGANYQCRVQYRDSGNQYSTWTNISKTTWFRIRYHYREESGPSANDGIAKLWLDDTVILDVTDADSDVASAITQIDYGFRYGTDTGTEGTLYIDDVSIYDMPP